MNKKIRTGLVPVVAEAIKPPAYELDPTGGEDHVYKCVYVTSGGTQVTQRCSKYVWQRCMGGGSPGRNTGGLNHRIDSEFILWVDKNQNTKAPNDRAKGLIVDLDILPERYYQHRQVMPEEVKEQDYIQCIVTPTGGIDVEKVPAGVTRGHLERLIKELNNIDTLEPGDMVPGGYEIVSAAGNKLSLAPPSARASKSR